jgi:hypothetical protein
MPRTTLDLDAAVLRELKRRQAQERKTLGQIASELLARSLAEDRPSQDLPPLRWSTTSMGMKVDIADKDALWKVLDER